MASAPASLRSAPISAATVPLDLARRKPPTVGRGLRFPIEVPARDVIAVASAALERVARHQALAALVKQLAGERTGGNFGGGRWCSHGVFKQAPADLLPQLPLDNRLVLTRDLHG